MKLVVAVVQSDDAPALARALAENGFQATRLPSRGGFLNHENTTFLIGVEDVRLEEVKALIVEKAEARTVPHEDGELEVGGAVVFVLDLMEFLKL